MDELVQPARLYDWLGVSEFVVSGLAELMEMG